MDGYQHSPPPNAAIVAGEPDPPPVDAASFELLGEFVQEAEASLLAIDPAVLRLERDPGDLTALSEAFRVMHTLKGTGGFLGLTRLSAVAHATEEVLDQLRREATTGTAGDEDRVGPILLALDRLGRLLRAARTLGREPPGDDDDVLTALRPTHPDPMHADRREVRAAIPGVPVPARIAEPAIAGDTGAAGAIRVAVPVLERLLASVGELVLARNQLLHQVEHVAGDAALGLLAQRIAGITAELQDAVLRTRMQPVGQAWGKLPRLVRDLARALGKQIVIETSGTDVELDRQVLDLIRDPLTHMVRNSCDHGIEPPDARVAAGKPATGRIVLSARAEGASVVVVLRDDGRGIDPARLRAKAQAEGLASAAELASMTDAQALTLVFRPGLSTAAEVTAVSGRGVGMDVVKSNIEQIGGAVTIASVPGQGTTLTLTIPLTLAIVPALMVAARGQRFALPRIAVGEIVRAPLARRAEDARADGAAVVTRLDRVPLLRLRDELLPLVDLGDLLGISPATPVEWPDQCGEGTVWHVVVVRTGALTYGLVVDPVFDAEEIVVTPLCALLKDVGVFSGTTIQGDGALALVLDPSGLARDAGVGTPTATDAAPVAARPADGADALPMLLFTASGQPMAVPLGLIARLEEAEVRAFAPLGDGVASAYTLRLGERLVAVRNLRGQPIETADRDGPVIPTLIVDDGHGRRAGLAIDRFEDVVTEPLRIEAVGVRPGVLGGALLGGGVRAVLDTRHWLTRMDPGWFDHTASEPDARRLLVVEDSDFFRQLLVPSLTAAGYAVTSVASPIEALALRDAGGAFDAIVTDIEMPGMDGLAFVAALRAGGRWRQLPVVALTARATPADIAAGRAAGFTDHIRKFERAALLAALDRCLPASLASAEAASP